METETNNKEELNARALLITIGVLILIPIVYVLFIKKEAVETPQPVVTQQQQPAPAVAQTPAPNALENARQTAESNPTELNYINLALQYFYAKDYNACIEASRKALKVNPNSALAYNNICSAYNCMAKWDSAIIAGQAALRANPDLQIARNNLNWAYQMKKKGN